MRTWILLLACAVAGVAHCQTYRWSTIAGTRGYSELDFADGTNNSARFHNPMGLARDALGNLYVADMANSVIRKVAFIGGNWVVSTLAGQPGVAGLRDGTNSGAQFSFPQYLTVDDYGGLYVADNGNNGIRKMTLVGTNWIVKTLAGGTPTFG